MFVNATVTERGRMTVREIAEILRSLTLLELDALLDELGPDWPGGATGGVREPRRPIHPRRGAGAALRLVHDDT